MARGKKTPSSTFRSGQPAAAETPAQVVSPIREDQGRNVTDDAQEAPATNLTDFDGDQKPGGSLSQLAWETAEVAWAAVYRWTAIRQPMGQFKPWADLADAERLYIAQFANRCIEEPAWVAEWEQFPPGRWESEVRSKIFAAVVRSIAL